MYYHLVEVLHAESPYGQEPVTDEDIVGLLEAVERALGESTRHRVEHVLNISEAANLIVERFVESDVQPGDAEADLENRRRWVAQWVEFNWSVSCVVTLVDDQVVAPAEVLAVILADAHEAANALYLSASIGYDNRLGDVEDDEE